MQRQFSVKLEVSGTFFFWRNEGYFWYESQDKHGRAGQVPVRRGPGRLQHPGEVGHSRLLLGGGRVRLHEDAGLGMRCCCSSSCSNKKVSYVYVCV